MPSSGERRPNIIRRHDEPVVVKDVALADLSSERLYVAKEFLLQRALFIRQRWQRSLVTVSGHADHGEPSCASCDKNNFDEDTQPASCD